MSYPHFKVPLNLPHAAKIAARLRYHLDRRAPGPAGKAAYDSVESLTELLRPCEIRDENPADENEGKRIADEAAVLGRALVASIESLKIGDDRLGQAIRNLFECLGMGEEGAQISLRAGENPKSALRPAAGDYS